MKKVIAILLAAAMAASFTACNSDKGETGSNDPLPAAGMGGDLQESSGDETQSGGDETSAEEDEKEPESEGEKPETVKVTCLNGDSETVEIEVPYDPQRIAVVDFASLDILDNLGLGDRVVGASNVTLDYLSSYNESAANLGTIKTADMEALMLCDPDIIFMSGRLSDSYDAFMEIAPVVRLTSDSSIGLVESVRKNAKTIASIFGLEDQVDEKLSAYDSRIEALSKTAENKTALVVMCSGGSFSLLGNDGRCSIIGTEIGFQNIGVSEDVATATHGNEASFEFIVAADPDYMFVMDRDAAIGSDGAKLAKDVMENELVVETNVYKNGNIVYLENSGIWYTAEGGITALGIMLDDLETALLNG